ncbi:hypothetical protein KDM41_15680, partial [bacterium]|nr:hypothetical protein [bacterium]
MDPFQDEPQQGGGGFDIMGLVRAFWRRKLLFFVPFILCLSMAAVAIKTMTPIYASTGQILIKFEGLNSRLLTDPSNRFGRPQYIDAVAFQEMNMLLTSPDFLQKMVLELRLQDALREEAQKEGEPPLTDEQAIRKARGKLAGMVRLKQDGQRLFKFEVRDPDPEQAYRLASFILDRFVEEYRETQTASSTSMRDFLQRQLEVYNTKLANAEQALTEFQASIASEALVDNPINASNLGYAQASVQALRERYDGTDARELQDLTAGVSRLLGNVPNVSRYRSDDIIRSTGQEMENLGLENQLYSPNSRESRDV